MFEVKEAPDRVTITLDFPDGREISFGRCKRETVQDFMLSLEKHRKSGKSIMLKHGKHCDVRLYGDFTVLIDAPLDIDPEAPKAGWLARLGRRFRRSNILSRIRRNPDRG